MRALVIPLLLALTGCPAAEPVPGEPTPTPTPEPSPTPCEESAWYADADLDGFGDPTSEVLACEAPDGHSPDATDCDDEDPTVSPAAREVCDSVDWDCTGDPRDLDLDGDGHSPCRFPGDCDDEDADAFPRVLDPDGDDLNPGTPGAPLAHLQAAFDSIDEVCRTVHLQPGTYTTTAAWTVGDVVVQGASRDGVIVRPPTNNRVLDLQGGEFTFRDLTLEGNGTLENTGAGVLLQNLAQLNLFDVDVRGFRSNDYGGAIAAYSANVSVERAHFEDNHADHGGGIYIEMGRLESADSTYLSHTGSAMSLQFSRGTMVGDTFQWNEGHNGGAITMDTPRNLEIRGALFDGNEAQMGGAIGMWGPTPPAPVLRNNRFVANIATDLGGALSVSGFTAQLTVVNNTFFANQTDGEGADIHIDAGASPAVFVGSNLMAWGIGPSALHMVEQEGGVALANTAWGFNLGTGFIGVEDGGDNVFRDPLLVDPYGGDFSLDGSSPARDSGLEGDAYLDPDGSRNDRGVTGGPFGG